MEALKRKTLADLLTWPDERVELIAGEIVHRPLPRFRHASAQGNLRGGLQPICRGAGPDGGWWFATEVSVAYEAHECPVHDLAGWRRTRLPHPPEGIIDLPPDWVCEIVSPGHEHKDTRQVPDLLRRHGVPWYWLIWPEDRVLQAQALVDGDWRILLRLAGQGRARIPPFEAIELDLAELLGGG